MLDYQVREWHTVTYSMDVEEFKIYVKELRFFYESYVKEDHKPKFIQLLRSSSQGFVTECATIPLDMVEAHDSVSDIDLDKWFNNNYQKVYNYLVKNGTKLY